MEPQPFVLGVNYWPRRKAMAWWKAFDRGEVEDEFGLIAELGMKLVRIFLLWEDFQPDPQTISRKALEDLEQTCEIAAAHGLQLDITFFTGHMSGPSWVPAWMLVPGASPLPHVRQVVSGGQVVNQGYLNPFTEPLVLQAAERLLTAVVSRLASHPAVGLWNLGNEPDLFAWPPNAAAGRQWVRRMTAVIHQHDDRHPVTCGLHTANLLQDNGLRINEVFAEVDQPVMHGYPMYIDWVRDPLDPAFVPFACALTSALCGRPALMEEFGGCSAPPGQPSQVMSWQSFGRKRRQFMASEDDLATHIDQVLIRLVDGGATGALLWCFADYAPALYDRPPCDESQHERSFGLVRPDGSLKPHADVVKRFAASQPSVRPSRTPVKLGMEPEAYYRHPLANARRLYTEYLAAYETQTLS
jgi:endo-1,4-beta-mannosidase